MEQKMMEMLYELSQKIDESAKEQRRIHAQINERLDAIDAELAEVKKGISLLTSQTSNAVIEHHGTQIDFLKDKLNKLEEELYILKRNWIETKTIGADMSDSAPFYFASSNTVIHEIITNCKIMFDNVRLNVYNRYCKIVKRYKTNKRKGGINKWLKLQ